MPIQLQCKEKGCMKLTEAYLDPKVDKVYCADCGKEMQVNHFTKVQLKTLKQYKQKTISRFSVKCNICNNEDTPILNNGVITCSSCQKPLTNLSPIFITMLKDQLKKSKEIA